MPKRTIWKQASFTREEDVAPYLTAHNLQPNKFKLVGLGRGRILLVYVEKEIPNVE